MATEVSARPTVATRQAPSPTAWLWWKETRQLAPLIGLLAAVSLLLILVNLFTGLMGVYHGFRLNGAMTMLVFPALLATGAGPLLVGQERILGTMNWLALLPISVSRLAWTKFAVALAGLAVMWVFALTMISVLDLSGIGPSPWTIGQRISYTGTIYSYPFWICHSLFVLSSGFYVSWRFKNQFYAMVALIVLAFLPFVATSILADVFSISQMSDGIEWMNLALTLVGLAVVTPLGFVAANTALRPAAPDTAGGRRIAWPDSPAASTDDAIPPRFGLSWTPIAWQSIHSSKGMLAILVGMLIVSFLASMRLASLGRLVGIDQWMQLFVLAAPLAVSWLGVSVFKNDGSQDRVRFLADRGVSSKVAYFALHAVPLAILATALLVYGIWNLTISHSTANSPFAARLPTLVVITMYALMIYGVSQWTSQVFRTLMLSVIFAPILSAVLVGWLVMSHVVGGLPVYALVLCGLLPFAVTFLMMNRYMDSRDRPSGLILSGVVLAALMLWPIGHATAYVLSVPRLDDTLREQLLSEATRIHQPTALSTEVRLNGYVPTDWRIETFDRDRVREMEQQLQLYQTDPMKMVAALAEIEPEKRVARTYLYDFTLWYGGLSRARIAWRQSPDESTREELDGWVRASGILLPALRRSVRIEDQEVADRLEVLLIDTLDELFAAGLGKDEDVRQAAANLGTPASRAEARRRAVLATWRRSLIDPEKRHRRLQIARYSNDPPGLVAWTAPRWDETWVAAMLKGIEAAKQRSNDDTWRREMHELTQPGGDFQTSRYGDSMRDRPAIETMGIATITGNGQLWGRDWEYVEPTSRERQSADDEVANDE